MAAAEGTFGVGETHGILWRDEHVIHAASDALGWRSAYASLQRERPYEDEYRAVPDHLVILHRDGPVGVGRVLGAARRHRTVPPGGLFILPGGMDFGVRLEGRLESLHVYVRDSVLREVAAESGAGDPAHLSLVPRLGEQDALIEQLMIGLGEALDADEPGTPVYADTLARALAARLLRRHSSRAGTRAASPVRGALPRATVARVCEAMAARLQAPLGLDDLAAVAGLSASHFARGFRAATGLPPHRYLMRLRVERAQVLLRATDRPIADVALDCGFAHQEHLTRVFARLAGCTPAAWRRAVRT
ncbi:helix-turn-helix domain-containing protein [Acidisphaera rubrifaciens]|uniref:Transcriptional regulator AraC n=1 Tax=Acidisphaera rubrifaciens HS-AP3 TaxID=1231350 RepID=A0A0D6P828_9PROT|nr:AraC family transcriptional regulator [Acidisphaera rubrifaciens]GAN77812.1 transcriptional regulator AraC [Acidisphaera rubrifaciens HS-AP3]